MKVTKLTPNISVAHQLTEQDLEEAAAAGFETIINNRPDGEVPDQPPKRGARGRRQTPRPRVPRGPPPGLTGRISTEQVEAFRTALGGAEKPALAFCRTGTRSATCSGRWRPATAFSASEILQTTSEAGLDLEALRTSWRTPLNRRSSST